MSLADIMNKIETSKEELKSFETQFLDLYNKTLVADEESRKQPIPTEYFRPSSLGGGCKRMLYFQRTGAETDGGGRDPILIGICDSGTDRHERIQDIVAKMDGVTTIDIEEVVKEANQQGINTSFVSWNSDHTEARCKNDDLKIYFQADGCFKFMGKECLLEIKTINTFAFKKLLQPKTEHLKQATCYAMGLGLKYVLFFYEERNFTNHTLFLVEITDEMKAEMREKIATIEHYLEQKQTPPKEDDKCQYCEYKNLCEKVGE